MQKRIRIVSGAAVLLLNMVPLTPNAEWEHRRGAMAVLCERKESVS